MYYRFCCCCSSVFFFFLDEKSYFFPFNFLVSLFVEFCVHFVFNNWQTVFFGEKLLSVHIDLNNFARTQSFILWLLSMPRLITINYRINFEPNNYFVNFAVYFLVHFVLFIPLPFCENFFCFSCASLIRKKSIVFVCVFMIHKNQLIFFVFFSIYFLFFCYNFSAFSVRTYTFRNNRIH